MSDDDLRRLHAEARTDASSAGCPTPERLRDAAERSGSESERLATLDHLAGCAECRAEFDLMRAVALAARDDAGVTRRNTFLMGLAAAIVLLAGASVVWRASRPEPIRGSADQVRLLAPGERWEDPVPPRFVWSGAGAGTVYLFELVDSAGRARVSRTTPDTSLTLPDSLTLVPGTEYRWWVRARLTDGREVPSSFRVLRVMPR